TLAPGFVVSRIGKGNWQLAERHGAPYAREAALDDMRRFVEAGITLFHCADHYVGVEPLIGEFPPRHPDHARPPRALTHRAAARPAHSVLQRRARRGRAGFCAAHGIRVLCYGTLAGGFIGERWLGAPEPHPPFANRSLVKYRLIVDDFGGWRRFQELLDVLDAIATRHRVSVASVAIRYVLDKPGVAGAIVGARNAAHLDDLVQAVTLDEGDRAAIARIVSQATGPRGDCYELERVEEGPHSMIMWKNQ